MWTMYLYFLSTDVLKIRLLLVSVRLVYNTYATSTHSLNERILYKLAIIDAHIVVPAGLKYRFRYLCILVITV